MAIRIQCHECQTEHDMVKRLLNVYAYGCPLLMKIFELRFRQPRYDCRYIYSFESWRRSTRIPMA